MLSLRSLLSSFLSLAICLGVFGIGLPVLLTGCGEEAPADAEAAVSEHADEESDDEGDEDESEDEDEHGGHAAVHVDPILSFPSRELTFLASDDVQLVGHYYDPTLEPLDPDAEEEEEDDSEDEEGEDGHMAKPNPLPESEQYPLVILLHHLNGNNHDWHDLPMMLVKQGYAVLAMDLRGHGKSTMKEDRTVVTWRNFEPNDWQMLPKDISRVLRLIETNAESPHYKKVYRHVNTHKVAIIGASIGANTAIFAGSKQPDRIKALAVLSPGIDYKGLVVSIPIVSYRNPIFITASQSDTYSNESADTIYHWARGEKSIRIFKNVGHGTDMLINQHDLKKTMVNWLSQVFPGKRREAKATHKPAMEKPHSAEPEHHPSSEKEHHSGGHH